MLLLASSVCGLFKWRQFEPEVILLAVGWYLRFSLSYRDVEELLAEREHAGYPPAIVRLKAEETLAENCRHRPVQHLNNVLEHDHRAIKRRMRASQHFRSFLGAWRTDRRP
jgi:transposase-like protein